MDSALDVLVVAPHPDDAEISVGGTILACKAAGMRVGVVELTNGEPCLRQPTGGCSSLLGKAEQNGHAGGAILAASNVLLLEHPSADSPETELRF